MKQIAILGSTGSIGTQALQVIEELDVDDFARVGEAAAPLMGNSGSKALADAWRQAEAEASPS